MLSQNNYWDDVWTNFPDVVWINHSEHHLEKNLLTRCEEKIIHTLSEKHLLRWCVTTIIVMF